MESVNQGVGDGMSGEDNLPETGNTDDRKTKLSKVISGIKSLKVEPFLFLILFGWSVSSIVTQQLIQDKICINKYNQSRNFCYDLSENDDGENNQNGKDVKSLILSDLVTFNMKNSFVNTIPAIFWCLIIGSVCDRFIIGRKMFMISSTIACIVRDLLVMFNAIYFDYSANILLITMIIPTCIGSFWAAITAAFAYVALHSSPSNRAIRFLLVDVAYYSSMAAGPVVGALFLKSSPLFGGKQLFNYCGVYVISLVCHFVALIWVIFVINESKETIPCNQPDETLVDDATGDVVDGSLNNEDTDSLIQREGDTQTPTRLVQPSFFNVLKEILHPNNVKDLFHTVIVKRRSGHRTVIVLLFMTHIISYLSYVGLSDLMFGFVEKCFGYDAIKWSNVSTIGSCINPIVILIFVPIFSKYFKISDVQLGIIGTVSKIVSSVSLGSINTEHGLYLSYATGAVSGMTPIGIRSKMSKIVTKDESTKIFSALTTIEVLIPFISSLMYTNIFAATINWYPNLVFQISACILLIPLILFVTIEIKFDHKFRGDTRRNSDVHGQNTQSS